MTFIPKRSSGARGALLAGLAAGLLLAAAAPAGAQEKVKLSFRATVPADTPPYDVVFVSGNCPELGDWNPGLVSLAGKDGVYALDVEVKAGAPLEYKYTRGTWDTVEKGADFSELENRRFTPLAPAELKDTVLKWADKKPYLPEKATVTGAVKYHPGFRSRALGNKRTLAVWLPPSYDRAGARRYPVIYMHDGQNLFDKATAFIGEEWGVDEAAAALAAQPALEAIIVGVYNTGERLAEYTPFRDAERGGGKGRDYARFLVKEVKPFIDASYRTLSDRRHTTVAGSSLGGLISLYLLLEYPEVFSAAGVLSPSLYWAGRALPGLAEKKAAAGKMRIWLSLGTEEGDGGDRAVALEDARKLRKVLLGKGFAENKDLVYVEEQGARHSERYWALQVPALLRFLLGSGS